MPALSVIPDLRTNPDEDLDAFLHHEGQFAEIEKIARLPEATETGKPAVIIKIRLPDGSIVFAGTTQALYMGVASAFKGAEEREQALAKGEKIPLPKCNILLQALNQPHPRTCVLCGLGPCRNIQPAGS